MSSLYHKNRRDSDRVTIRTARQDRQIPHNLTGVMSLVDAFQETGTFSIRGEVQVTSVMHLGRHHLCIMIPMDGEDAK